MADDPRKEDPVDPGVDLDGIALLLERRDACKDKGDRAGMKHVTDELRDMYNVVVNDKNRSWSIKPGISRKPVRSDVLTLETEKKPATKPGAKPGFGVSEAKLRALAEAERQRRAQAQEAAPSKRSATPSQRAGAPPKNVPKPPPSVSSAKGSRPPTANDEGAKEDAAGQKHSQVVKVHSDGSFDLKLNSGEVIERVGPEWFERLKINGAPPPPPTASSRPPTGLSRPSTGLSRPATGQSERPSLGEAAPPFVAATTFEGARPGWVFKCGTQGLGYYQEAADDLAPSAVKAATTASQPKTNENVAPANERGTRPITPAVVNLDTMVDLDATLAGVGRKGGRGNVGAMRAARSEVSSLLAWS